MTHHTPTAPTTPSFEGLPRRKLAWSWSVLALWVLFGAGFVASVSMLPDAAPGGSDAAVAELPCPPTCTPARG